METSRGLTEEEALTLVDSTDFQFRNKSTSASYLAGCWQVEVDFPIIDDPAYVRAARKRMKEYRVAAVREKNGRVRGGADGAG